MKGKEYFTYLSWRDHGGGRVGFLVKFMEKGVGEEAGYVGRIEAGPKRVHLW